MRPTITSSSTSIRSSRRKPRAAGRTKWGYGRLIALAAEGITVWFMPRSVPEDDNYGPQTQAAVNRFHAAHPSYRAAGKSYDPAIGPKGWAHLHRTAHAK